MALDKPSDKEDEFFLKMEADRLKKVRSKLDEAREEAKKAQKNEHWMKCPKCGGDLKEIELSKVMIDQCTKCNGIWLDAGELELLTTCSDSKSFFGKLFS